MLRGMTKTQAAWAERVRQWRASGKTADEFAQSEDFAPSTLRYWASRLKREPERDDADGGGERVRMMRVKRAPKPEVTTPLVVTVGGARIEVAAGFDRAVLRELVEVLGGGG